MTGPLYLPTTELVTAAWLRMASGVRVDTELPKVDAQLYAEGAIRIGGMANNGDGVVPMHSPVVFAECWVPPNPKPVSSADPAREAWLIAAQIAQRLWNATFDPALQGVVIDLSTFGSYAPARVHDVTAITEPERNPSDPDDWARFDIELAFTWTQGA